MSYIKYQEAEKLIESLPLLEQLRQSAWIDLCGINAKESMGTDSDYIYSLAVGVKNLSDMPSTNSKELRSATETAAHGYEYAKNTDYDNVRLEIQNEIISIRVIEDKINLAIGSLSLLQQNILQLFYKDKLSWKEVIEKIKSESSAYYSKRQAQEQRRFAIDKITRISKVTDKEYREVIGIVRGKVE